MSAAGQARRELGGDDAAAADGGVADDADAHAAVPRRPWRRAAASRMPRLCRIGRPGLEQVRPGHRLAHDEAFGVAYAGERAELGVAALDQLREQRRREARRGRRVAGGRELRPVTGERLRA